MADHASGTPPGSVTTRSSLNSDVEAIDDRSVDPKASPPETLASPSSSALPLSNSVETPPDEAVVAAPASLDPPLQASDDNNLFCDRDEETQKDEPSSSSPANCGGNGFVNYGSNSNWSSGPLSRSSSWSSTDSSFSIQEAKPSMVGAGLMNLGNTCFINAVLQCFTHTVPLVHGLSSCNHAMPCERACKDFCVLCALHDHIQLSMKSSGGIISPLKFVNNLNQFSSCFHRYEQEDAHEFLQCFLDKLERCFLDSKTAEKSLTSSDENLVERVFGGRLISKLQCCNCGHCSDTFEPLIDLSLEIENADSLPSALESFTNVEKIEDSDTKFTCENCKEEVSVKKQLMVDRAPSVAIFHLKRFKADGSYVEKIDKHLKFPLELDLQCYTTRASDDNVNLMYDLYAIVVHVGSSAVSGHYFSFIRSSPDTWHRLDDSKVTRVSEEFVLSQEAYILCYARRGTPWLSSLLGADKPSLDPRILSTSPQSVLDNVENACPHPSLTEVNASVSCDYKILSENVNVCNTTPTTSHGESNCHQGIGEVSADADVFRPLTPPRSPSPDMISFETPGPSYQIPRDHLKSEERPTEKRSLNKTPDESERKEAIRYLTRSMPRSRGNKLMDALFSSEGASRKKRRFETPCQRAGGSASARHKSVVRPVAAVLR